MSGAAMFGVVGHADLTAESWGLVEDAFPAVLRRLAPHGLMGVVRAAGGLPLVFGRAVRRAGGSLVVVRVLCRRLCRGRTAWPRVSC